MLHLDAGDLFADLIDEVWTNLALIIQLQRVRPLMTVQLSTLKGNGYKALPVKEGSLAEAKEVTRPVQSESQYPKLSALIRAKHDVGRTAEAVQPVLWFVCAGKKQGRGKIVPDSAGSAWIVQDIAGNKQKKQSSVGTALTSGTCLTGREMVWMCEQLP